MFTPVVFALVLVSVSCCEENVFNFENFYQEVVDALGDINDYELPTDNSAIATVADNSTYDYGSFDFVIVGAGAAGTVLANRLSQIEKWSVLLLEAGGEQENNVLTRIPGYTGSLANSEMNWGYYTTPQDVACLGMNNHSCLATRGKVLGGSTVINGKVMVRGNKEDFDSWARAGNIGWSYEDVLPLFKKLERSHIPNGDEDYRGTDGEIDVSHYESIFVTDMYFEAMQELNYSIVDYNGKNQIGASKVQSSKRGNLAINGARAFIEPIRNVRKNLNITTNAVVSKVLINEATKVAYGVEFIKNGQKFQVKASKEVILSAGAINTPQILMLSGIGPKEELEKHDIQTLIDLPVGRNLQDHIATTGPFFHTNRSILNASMEVYLRKYVKNHRPLTAAANIDSTAFVNVDDPYNTTAQPNIQYINVAMPGIASSDFSTNYDPYSDFMMTVALLHPKSRGTVTLKSNSIIDFPNIDYKYLTDPDGEDIETIYKGVLHAMKLLETDAFKAYNVSIINVSSYCGDLDSSREYWYCNIRNLGTTVFHPVGTTAMGVSTKNSVVGPNLLVHGVGRLRIADAGIMPTLTSGNTQSPVYMIGEKAAQIIKRSYLRNFSE